MSLLPLPWPLCPILGRLQGAAQGYPQWLQGGNIHSRAGSEVALSLLPHPLPCSPCILPCPSCHLRVTLVSVLLWGPSTGSLLSHDGGTPELLAAGASAELSTLLPQLFHLPGLQPPLSAALGTECRCPREGPHAKGQSLPWLALSGHSSAGIMEVHVQQVCGLWGLSSLWELGLTGRP